MAKFKENGNMFDSQPGNKVQVLFVTSNDNWYSDGLGDGVTKQMLNDLRDKPQSTITQQKISSTLLMLRIGFFGLAAKPPVFKYKTFYERTAIPEDQLYKKQENGEWLRDKHGEQVFTD